jgi:hypothetical protein
MSAKSKNKRTGIWVVSGTICMTKRAFLAVMPKAALAGLIALIGFFPTGIV